MQVRKYRLREWWRRYRVVFVLYRRRRDMDAGVQIDTCTEILASEYWREIRKSSQILG